MAPDVGDAVPPPPEPVSRGVPAARRRVWDAFTRPEQVARWLGPPGVSIKVLSADVRPGGGMHYAMVATFGPRAWGRTVYRELDEPSRLVWVNCFADAEGNPVRAPLGGERFPVSMLNTVTLEPEGAPENENAGTRVTLGWAPVDATPAECRAVAEHDAAFRAAWAGSLERLARFLAAGAPP